MVQNRINRSHRLVEWKRYRIQKEKEKEKERKKANFSKRKKRFLLYTVHNGADSTTYTSKSMQKEFRDQSVCC